MPDVPKPRSILLVRSAIEDFYEPSWLRALRDNGHEVSLFDTFEHLTRTPPAQGAASTVLASSDRVGWWQHRLLWGPRIAEANQALIDRVRAQRPEVVLMYLGHHYTEATIRALSEWSFVTLFHSDDPFGPRRHHPRYRLLHKALLAYRGAHFYRPLTTADARRLGMHHCETLLDFYRPWVDYPRAGPLEDEAVFIGHCEPGYRIECIIAAARAGLPLHVYSHEPQWQRSLPRDVADVVGPRRGLYDDAYRQKLTRAKVCVCFLSRWNRDVYTRRVFEIPACGGLLLCERSAFMESLYEEDKEAVYFSSREEFVDKLRFYLRHEAARNEVARRGHERVLAGGHDIHSRLRSWASSVARWRDERDVDRCAS